MPTFDHPSSNINGRHAFDMDPAQLPLGNAALLSSFDLSNGFDRLTGGGGAPKALKRKSISPQ